VSGLEHFERHRGRLFALAYRMTGSVSDSEDILQEARLRWLSVDGVQDAEAFLVAMVSRLAIDLLRSARVRRERYVGPWLPEPLVEADGARDDGPERALLLAEDLSTALMVALERLSPLERAAFLLHDIFELDFERVAAILEREPEACRQLASRARRNVRDPHKRRSVSHEEGERLARGFVAAVATGDVGALSALLAADAIMINDGGGKRHAALRPVEGRDRIVRFFLGVVKKRAPLAPDGLRYVWVNGSPGLVLRDVEGRVDVVELEVEEGRIRAIYMVLNPDKLGHLVLGGQSLEPTTPPAPATPPAHSAVEGSSAGQALLDGDDLDR